MSTMEFENRSLKQGFSLDVKTYILPHWSGVQPERLCLKGPQVALLLGRGQRGGACPCKTSSTEWKPGFRKSRACRIELDVGLEGDQICHPKICQFGIHCFELKATEKQTTSEVLHPPPPAYRPGTNFPVRSIRKGRRTRITVSKLLACEHKSLNNVSSISVHIHLLPTTYCPLKLKIIFLCLVSPWMWYVYLYLCFLRPLYP